ncbi:MAG TPA: hypothetical protein VF469_15620 [Kofleriaceae bacterium]
MRSERSWLIATVATALVAAGLVAGANAAADIYGVFRDPAHRTLSVYGDDRVAKYLLSTRYVQANFDGVLIGSSMSGNWDTGKMQSLHLYNESLNGGNMVEEKAIVDHLLERPGIRAALVVVHPFLTASHEFNTVQIGPREIWGALGSQNLFDAYKSALKIRLGREEQAFDAAGTEDMGEDAKKLNATLQAMMKPGTDFEIDPIALAAYRDIVAALRARHIPIAFVIPPTAEPLFTLKRDAFRRYAEALLGTRRPDERLLDFSSDEFAAFRQDASQFSDGVHLRGHGAQKITAIIDEHLKRWIAEGWLPHG